MIVAGLDVDSKGAHYTLWNGREAPLWGDLNSCDDLRVFVKAGVQVVYIEAIPYVKNFQTMKKLCEYVGRWQERIETYGLKHVSIAVSSWKAAAIGNGHAGKVEVKDTIIATTNIPDGLPQHNYDAAGIAIAGYGLENQARLAGVRTS